MLARSKPARARISSYSTPTRWTTSPTPGGLRVYTCGARHSIEPRCAPGGWREGTEHVSQSGPRRYAGVHGVRVGPRLAPGASANRLGTERRLWWRTRAGRRLPPADSAGPLRLHTWG